MDNKTKLTIQFSVYVSCFTLVSVIGMLRGYPQALLVWIIFLIFGWSEDDG